MNNKVRYGAGILLALLVLFCLGRALSLKEGLKQAEGAVLDLGDAGIGMLAAAEMLEKNQLLEEPMEFTLWEQQEDQTVESPEFSRSALVRGIALWGDSRLVLGGNGFLDASDPDGCLIDGDTALSLFGSRNIVGQTVRYGGRELSVRGILDGVSDTIVLEAVQEEKADTGQENFAFHHVTLSYGGERGKEVLAEFRNQFGVSGTVLPLSGYPGIAKGIHGMFFLVVLCSVCFPLLRLARTKAFREERYLCLAAAFGMIFAFFWIVRPDFLWPEDWIPGRWSDFSFWEALWKEQTGVVQELFFGDSSVPIWALKSPLLQCLWYTVCGTAAYIAGRRFWKVEGERELWIGAFAVIAAAFAVILWTDSPERRILWGLPLYVLVGLFLRSHFCTEPEGTDRLIDKENKNEAVEGMVKHG